MQANLRFLFAHPAHFIACGFGSGLSPWAPGTIGTLAAWVLYPLIRPHFSDLGFALFLLAAFVVGVFAAARTGRMLGVVDHGAIVWDEIVAFWLVLWWIAPAGGLMQLLAFALFRYFDAAKPGPVRWADRLFKPAPGAQIGWRQGLGILLDDLVAAACTLALMWPLQMLWTSWT